MLKKSSFYLILLIYFSACKPEKTSNTNTLNIRTSSSTNNLNPVTCTSSFSNYLCLQIFQTLLAFDFESEELVGVLAESSPKVKKINDNLLELSFKLREEAQFDDGKPIMAEDFIFSLKAHLCKGVNSSSTRFFQFIKQIEKDSSDSKSFKVICENLGNATPFYVGSIYILDKRVFDAKGYLDSLDLESFLNQEDDSLMNLFAEQFNSPSFSNQINNIQGTGSYRISQWKEGQQIVLEAKENWWGKQLEAIHSYFNVKSKRLSYQTIEDDNTALMALQSGEIDFSTSLGYQQVEKINQHLIPFNIESIEKTGYQFIGFNLIHPILKHLEVRRAISYCTPRELMLKNIFSNQGNLTSAPVSAKAYQTYFEKQFFEFNTDSAKSVLKQAGWKDANENGILDQVIDGNLVELTLDYAYNSDNEERKSVGLFLKQEAEKVGIQIRLSPYEWQTYNQKLRNDEFEIFYYAFSTNALPPDLSRTFHSDGIQRKSNLFGYQNEITDSLITAMKFEFDKQSHDELFIKATQQINNDMPCVFLWSLNEIMVSRPNISMSTSNLRPHYWAPAFVKE
tara:strand:- start:1886 stop:3583 length:1698 start_codon:yes stop_codon:yes gene_type:complete